MCTPVAGSVYTQARYNNSDTVHGPPHCVARLAGTRIIIIVVVKIIIVIIINSRQTRAVYNIIRSPRRKLKIRKKKKMSEHNYCYNIIYVYLYAIHYAVCSRPSWF